MIDKEIDDELTTPGTHYTFY